MLAESFTIIMNDADVAIRRNHMIYIGSDRVLIGWHFSLNK